MAPDELIRKRFNYKENDCLPMTPFRKEPTRVDLLGLFTELGYKTGAEIGVAQGYFSDRMMYTIPDLTLYSIDPYIKYWRRSQRVCDQQHRRAVKRLGKWESCTLIRKTGVEAAKDFEDGSLDFVYIDADHRFDAVMVDIITWAPKVRKGGILAGHDFFPMYQGGVMDAVYAYTRAHRIMEWYVTAEKEASWFWVVK